MKLDLASGGTIGGIRMMRLGGIIGIFNGVGRM